MQLEALRKKNGYSQEELSRIIGVSRNTIKNWEDGRTEPSVSIALKLANLFQISIEQLLQ